MITTRTLRTCPDSFSCRNNYNLTVHRQESAKGFNYYKKKEEERNLDGGWGGLEGGYGAELVGGGGEGRVAGLILSEQVDIQTVCNGILI